MNGDGSDVIRAFRVAYDGREFAGFQRQPHARTVEGTLLRALAAHDVIDAGDGPTHATPPEYAAAGRTDAGVSAVAQTIGFEAPSWLTPRAFNGQLPGSVRVWAAADVPAGFHATHDAVERTYRYQLLAPESATTDRAVHDALDRLSGRHDFRNLTTDEAGTERTLTATATRSEEFLVIEATAGGFPRAFVRRLVSLVHAVGTGTVDPAFVGRVLDPEPLPGEHGIGAAPPEPLVLWDVTYDGVTFDIDREAAASARDAFDERYREAKRAAAMIHSLKRGVDPEP